MIFGQLISPSLRESNSLAEDWMLFLILIILGITAMVRWNYSKSLSELFASVVNINKLREIMREELVLTSRASQLLLIISFMSYALFIYLAFKLTHISLPLNIEGFLLYGLILTGVVLIYGNKYLLILIIKVLYKGDFTLSEYEFNVNLYLKLSGILLLPVSIFLIYSDLISSNILAGLGVSIISGSMLWRYGRGVANALSNRVSILYIILYLCAFEILPTAAMLKALL